MRYCLMKNSSDEDVVSPDEMKMMNRKCSFVCILDDEAISKQNIASASKLLATENGSAFSVFNELFNRFVVTT